MIATKGNVTVKVPSLRQMQLGQYYRSPGCGCLFYHATHTNIPSPNLRTKFWKAYQSLVPRRLEEESCPNTLANRRKALTILKSALVKAGFKLKGR